MVASIHWHWERILQFVHHGVLPGRSEVREVGGVELLRGEVRERLRWVVAELERLLVLLHRVKHVVLGVASILLLSAVVAVSIWVVAR